MCDKCQSVIEYEDKYVWEGNRNHEDVCCPKCGAVVASVFTDLIPLVKIK